MKIEKHYYVGKDGHILSDYIEREAAVNHAKKVNGYVEEEIISEEDN